MKGIKRMNDLKQHAIEQASAATASKLTYTGGATSMAGWLISNEFIAVGGFALAVLGFAVNVYFKVRDDRRQQSIYDAQMRDIETRKEILRKEVDEAVDTRLSRNAGHDIK